MALEVQQYIFTVTVSYTFGPNETDKYVVYSTTYVDAQQQATKLATVKHPKGTTFVAFMVPEDQGRPLPVLK